MKSAKKLLALVLAAMLVLAMSATAFAQDVDTAAENTATITIQNAAKGETYKVYKLFDATVTGADGGSIAYTGDIPQSLSSYFEKDKAGNISVKSNIDKDTLYSDLANWAKTATAANSAVSDGSVLNFNGLAYGYYVVTSTQTTSTTDENGTVTTKSVITVTSTNPNATIYDKNSTTPAPDGGDDGNQLKVVAAGDDNVSIGDTITYTIKFSTVNFEGAGENAKRVLSYTITDTLPDFLEDVTVTSIKIGNVAYTVKNDENTDVTPQFNKDGKITIPWASKDEDGNYTSLYANGAVIEVTYTAQVNDQIEVGGADTANKNSVTITWKVEDTSESPDPDGTTSQTTLTGDVVIKTYAAAIQKVDESGNSLAGAKFRIKGLTVTGSNGNYTVVSYDSSETTTVEGTEMEADDNGLIVINGIASDETLVATETKAPDGYNKLTDTVNVTPVQTSATVTTTTTTTYYDAEGNKVDSEEDSVTSTTVVSTLDAVKNGAQKIENKAGSTLPSTGGVGTTIFYVIGGVLVVAAGVLLVTKKRMGAER